MEYDLTSTVLRYTDRHLGFPLLSHLAGTGWYKQQDIAKAQYELARGSEWSVQETRQAAWRQAGI